jgi:hypothetical protein
MLNKIFDKLLFYTAVFALLTLGILDYGMGTFGSSHLPTSIYSFLGTLSKISQLPLPAPVRQVLDRKDFRAFIFAVGISLGFGLFSVGAINEALRVGYQLAPISLWVSGAELKYLHSKDTDGWQRELSFKSTLFFTYYWEETIINLSGGEGLKSVLCHDNGRDRVDSAGLNHFFNGEKIGVGPCLKSLPKGTYAAKIIIDFDPILGSHKTVIVESNYFIKY